MFNLVKFEGIRCHPARVKPFLSEEHRDRRRRYAWDMSDWNGDDWCSVVCIDEFNVNTSDIGRPRVWRRRGERLKEECIATTSRNTRKSFSVIVR